MNGDATPTDGRSRSRTRRTILLSVGAVLLMAASAAVALTVGTKTQLSGALANATDTAGGVATQGVVVVSVGDSFISGEAGRWAGNTNRDYSGVDALGPTAYFDNASGTAEEIALCHRSRTSAAHIEVKGVTTVSLACSGATSGTRWDGRDFKPGLDFFDDRRGHRGQAAMLRELATTTDVRMIAVSIGLNDFGYRDVMSSCVKKFILSSALLPDYCNDESIARTITSPTHVDKVRTGIAAGLRNLRDAMRSAGRADDSYDVVVQLNPSTTPPSRQFRYDQKGLDRYRIGGCPLWNADADWLHGTYFSLVNRTVRAAADESGIQRVHVLDASQALDGRRLCERTVGLLEERDLPGWTTEGAADITEWAAQIRTISTIGSPYFIVEGVHPNYWGQQALQACLLLAWNDGAVRGGTCTLAEPGLTEGNPRMQLR